MSLPKRDGVHDRYYLIHKPDTSPEVLAEADLCIQDVLNGTARQNHSAYPTVVRNHNGTPFLPSQLLDRYLSKLPLKGFPYEEAVISVSYTHLSVSFPIGNVPTALDCFSVVVRKQVSQYMVRRFMRYREIPASGAAV